MRAGVSLFKVYVLGNGAFIREAVVTSRVKAAVYLSWPESNIRIGLAVDVKINFAGVCLKDVWFLSDMNVQDGGYRTKWRSCWTEAGWLEKGRFQLLLHGHRHIGEARQVGSVTGPTIKILGTGSAGLDRDTLPDHPNQYQIIHLENRKDVTLVMRQYSSQTFGLTGQGRWIADASLDESGVVTFSLGAPRPQRRPRPKSATSAKSTAFFS